MSQSGRNKIIRFWYWIGSEKFYKDFEIGATTTMLSLILINLKDANTGFNI
jgi:hypothetical protein